MPHGKYLLPCMDIVCLSYKQSPLHLHMSEVACGDSLMEFWTRHISSAHKISGNQPKVLLSMYSRLLTKVKLQKGTKLSFALFKVRHK